jgi:stage V sporulation protein G
LKDDRAVKDEDGRAKLYADIAHPINSACREMIQERVIKSFHEEIEKSRQPGYVSSYDDFDEDLVAGSHGERHAPRRSHERKEAAVAASSTPSQAAPSQATQDSRSARPAGAARRAQTRRSRKTAELRGGNSLARTAGPARKPAGPSLG